MRLKGKKSFFFLILTQIGLIFLFIILSYRYPIMKASFFFTACFFILFFICVSLKDILWGYLLIVLTIPVLNLARGPSFSLSFGDFWIVPLSYFVWLLFIIFLLTSSISKNKPVEIDLEDKLWFFFVFFSGFSILTAFYIPTNMQKATLIYFTGIIEPLIIYYILKKRLQSQKDVHIIIITIFASLCFSCGLGLARDLLNAKGIAEIFLMRESFTYTHPNIFSPVALLVLPLGLWLIAYSKRIPMKIAFFSLTSIIFMATLSTRSRGAIIILPILVLVLLSQREYRLPILFILIPLLIAIMYSSVVSFALLHRLMTISMKGSIIDPSTLVRLEGWRASFPIMKTYPFGVGGACFPYLWAGLSKYRGTFLSCSHHLFLSIGTEFGIIPLILFSSLLSFYLYKCIKMMKICRDRFTSLLSFSLFVGLLAYIGYGIISEGQLSHLSGWKIPIHSHSIILFSLLSVISFLYRRTIIETR